MKLKRHPRVSIDTKVCHGAPVIAGTRVPVALILGALAGGDTRAEILKDFPSLAPKDIDAALAFATELSRFEAVSVLDPAS